MTAALEGGEWSAARPGRTLPLGKTWYPFYRRLGGPQGRSGWAEILVPTGIRSRTVHPVVSRYTDWATRSTNRCEYQDYFLGGKGGRCVGLTTLPPSCADYLEIWEPQPSRTLRTCPGLYRDCFYCWQVSREWVRQCTWYNMKYRVFQKDLNDLNLVYFTY